MTQAAIYLSRAPKNREAVDARDLIKKVVQKTRTLPVPLHLRNASTSTQREMGYGKYQHVNDPGFKTQTYLPEALVGREWINDPL